MHKCCRDEYIHDAVYPSGPVDEKYYKCFYYQVFSTLKVKFLVLFLFKFFRPCVCVCVRWSWLFVCMRVLLSHLLHWAGRVLHSRVHGHWNCSVDVWTSTLTCRTPWKTKWRLEGDFEVVGECGWHTEDEESDETWENRRRGQDVVSEREGKNEAGGSEIKFEGQTLDWVYSLSMCLLVQALSECVGVCACLCVYFKASRWGTTWAQLISLSGGKRKEKLPSVKRFLLSAVNLWTCESRAYVGILNSVCLCSSIVRACAWPHLWLPPTFSLLSDKWVSWITLNCFCLEILFTPMRQVFN